MRRSSTWELRAPSVLPGEGADGVSSQPRHSRCAQLPGPGEEGNAPGPPCEHPEGREAGHGPPLQPKVAAPLARFHTPNGTGDPGLRHARGWEVPGGGEGPASPAALGEGRAFQLRPDPAGLGVGERHGIRAQVRVRGAPQDNPAQRRPPPHSLRLRSRAEDGGPALTCHAASEPTAAQCHPGSELPPVSSQPRGARDGRGRTGPRVPPRRGPKTRQPNAPHFRRRKSPPRLRPTPEIPLAILHAQARREVPPSPRGWHRRKSSPSQEVPPATRGGGDPLVGRRGLQVGRGGGKYTAGPRDHPTLALRCRRPSEVLAEDRRAAGARGAGALRTCGYSRRPGPKGVPGGRRSASIWTRVGSLEPPAPVGTASCARNRFPGVAFRGGAGETAALGSRRICGG